MTFDAIVAGQSVFVDANIFLYYFTAHPNFGAASQKLLDRIDNKEISGFTSYPAEVQQLTRSRQAIDEISLIGIDVLPVAKSHISLGADISCQTGLMCGDATVVAVMRDQGLTLLASEDPDFDRVPGITRYAPV
jgi:predicted nucleic acid-binding protein